MTISSEEYRSPNYVCNGSIVEFSVPFYILDETHIAVYLLDTTDGTQTKLTLTTHYTVVVSGLKTGNSITTVSTYSSDYEIIIIRAVPFTQAKDYIDHDTFPAESHEEGLDKLTMIVQQQQEQLDRSLRVPESDDVTDLVLPTLTNEGGKVLIVDPLEDRITYYDILGVDAFDPYKYYVNASAADQGLSTARSIKALVDAIGTTKKATLVLAHNGTGDTTTYTLSTSETIPSNITLEFENGAILADDASNATLTINGFIIADKNQTIFDWGNGSGDITGAIGGVSEFSLKWTGATGDNSTNDTDAWNTAVEFVNASQAVLYAPPGTYRLVPGSTTRLEVSLYGPQATIGAYDNTDDILLDIDCASLVEEDMAYVKLKALIGYDVANASVHDDTTVVSGTGMRIVSASDSNFTIQKILGFDIGVHLDGTILGADGVPVSQSVFRFGHIRHNNTGLKLECKDTYNTEDNEFWINYFYDNRTAALRLISGGGKVQTNIFNIGALEPHVTANAHGIHLSGTLMYRNTFIVLSITPPTGTGKIIVTSDTAVNNTFRLPTADWTKINMGANGNIFDMHTSYNSDQMDLGNTPPGRSMIRGAIAPVSAYWRAGDICWNDSPEDGKIGWVCIAAGSPGTWIPFGTFQDSVSITADQDDLDLAGAGVLWVDTTSNSITLGGLQGGVSGQRVVVVKTIPVNDLIIEDAEGVGTQDIYTPTSGSDITLSSRGGVTLMCNGAHWFVISE